MGRGRATLRHRAGAVHAVRPTVPGSPVGDAASAIGRVSTVPPLARRPVISQATALREEITDSWRLLGGSLGAVGTLAVLLFALATVLG